MPQLWDTKDEDKFDKKRQEKGLKFQLIEDVWEKVLAYCIANSCTLEKWRQKYVVSQNMDASLPYQTWLLEAMLVATSIDEVVNSEEMDKRLWLWLACEFYKLFNIYSLLYLCSNLVIICKSNDTHVYYFF